eukprot:4048301-Amphidinium_carterae.1
MAKNKPTTLGDAALCAKTEANIYCVEVMELFRRIRLLPARLQPLLLKDFVVHCARFLVELERNNNTSMILQTTCCPQKHGLRA